MPAPGVAGRAPRPAPGTSKRQPGWTVFGAPEFFREGAENSTRGGRAANIPGGEAQSAEIREICGKVSSGEKKRGRTLLRPRL